ncbi:hypothetical protein ACFL0I_01830 [Gemmatimonadota bacterium]
MKTRSNPFRIDGVVTPPHFTDRASEVARIRDALRSPPAKLLVYGPRRMGKTSTILVASHGAEKDGAHIVRADLSTASSMADVVNRMLAAAVRSIGRNWKDLATVFVERLKISVGLRPDPATGLAIPTLDASLRDRDADWQQATLGDTLDTLNALAGERGARLGVILDEFQEIHRLGGETAEWHLRGVIEGHANISYVLAGSRARLIERMISDPGRAFYKLLDQLFLGPMDDEHFSRWIDDRMNRSSCPAPGLGLRCIEVAGPRTRDVVQLARASWRAWSPKMKLEDLVDTAFRDIIAEEDVIAHTLWKGLTPHQQNVLRAAAGAEAGLTSRETLERFSLPASGTVSNTAAALVAEEILVKVDLPPGYDFESPFFRGWVVNRTLPDLGIDRPVTWRATLGN